MKNIMLTFALLFSVVMIAQENKMEPKYEIVDNMVKAEYFHDNGQLAQTGYYLHGKVHGEWTAFNEEGERIATGRYDQGQKVGKWFFWSGEQLNEVNYADSRIASVTKWKSENSIVVRN